MTDTTKTTRCTECRSEFTDAELDGAKACPTCGTQGVPMSIARDTTIRINTHELRILTMWASNYAASLVARDPSSRAAKAVQGIINALKSQVDVPLTLADEVQGLADATGSKTELHQDGDVKTFDPKPKN